MNLALLKSRQGLGRSNSKVGYQKCCHSYSHGRFFTEIVLSWVWTASIRMVQTTEGISGAFRKRRLLAEAKDVL